MGAIDVRSDGTHPAQSVELLHGKGPGGLDLHGDQASSLRDEEVDLVAIAIPEKMEIRCLSPVQLPFEAIDDDQVFENPADEGVARNLPGFPDAEQVAEEADVGKIVLGRLDHALAEVFEVRGQLESL